VKKEEVLSVCSARPKVRRMR